ncbi:hypothetical protein Fmac_020987 [Flemingia macrophylla]|uniref:Uncharacterized protein n=1 Tax=Flemingia macrophylla TaxID=520843 RepID=A0ABD1LXB0_9FABA
MMVSNPKLGMAVLGLGTPVPSVFVAWNTRSKAQKTLERPFQSQNGRSKYFVAGFDASLVWSYADFYNQGTKNTKPLTVNDVWSLSPNERVVVEWNDEDQATADNGALLNRFLGHLARDSDIFPISYTSWKKIPKDYKQNVLNDIIQAKFEVEHNLHVTYVFKSPNIKWREHHQELWQQRDDGTRNRDQLTAVVPEGLNKDQWASFIDYCLDSKTKEKSQKNKDNRNKQVIPHTGGSMSLARKKQKMELECGGKVSKGEIWIATHKHANGESVNEKAKEIGMSDQGSVQPLKVSNHTPTNSEEKE